MSTDRKLQRLDKLVGGGALAQVQRVAERLQLGLVHTAVAVLVFQLPVPRWSRNTSKYM